MHSGLLTLAIETTNTRPGPDTSAGVALVRGSSCANASTLGVEPLRPASSFDDDLLPAIDRLTSRLAVRPRDITRIALSVGPGGFTSLRIAVAATKAICEVTGARAIPVPTAAALIRGVDPSLLAPHSGGGGVVMCLAWKRTDLWRVVVPPQPVNPTSDITVPIGTLTSFDRLLDGCPSPRAIVMDEALEVRLREMKQLPDGPAILRPIFDPVAVAFASFALPGVDLLALAPVYPREPEAVTKWRDLKKSKS